MQIIFPACSEFISPLHSGLLIEFLKNINTPKMKIPSWGHSKFKFDQAEPTLLDRFDESVIQGNVIGIFSFLCHGLRLGR